MTPQPRARIYRGTARNLRLLSGKLRRGELVAVPTETVYGLAGNALDARVCRKIFAAKGRPLTDPLIVHIHALAQLDRLAVPNAAALALARKFWPGPLTIILPKTDLVPGEVTAGRPSVAVRMPAHPLLRRLLKLCALPLAAPSANPFGYVSPTTARHVRDSLGHKINHILDGGSATIGLESTIVDLRDPQRPRLLRPGAITRKQLERTLRRPLAASSRKATPQDRAQLAPGMLHRHYSPKARVVLHQKLTMADIAPAAARTAWVFQKKPVGRPAKNVFWLDPKGELKGVANQLFDRLRQLDAAGFRTIHIERAAGSGLAEAINDRLTRAAAR